MFLEDNINVKTQVKEVRDISKNKNGYVLLVRMKNWEDKQEIMKNKSKLRNTKIYIENDRTIEERNTEWELRKIAREERDKGKSVRVGYNKLIIEGRCYTWNRREKGLVPSTSNQAKN